MIIILSYTKKHPIVQILGKVRLNAPQDRIVLFLEASEWPNLIPRLARSFFCKRAWVWGYQWPRLICSFHPHLDTPTGFHPPQWRQFFNFLQQGSPIVQIWGKFRSPCKIELILFLEANEWCSLIPGLACSFFHERAWVWGYRWPRLICSFHPHLDTPTGFHPPHCSYSCVCVTQAIVSFPGVEEGEEKEHLVHTVCTRQWTHIATIATHDTVVSSYDQNVTLHR